MRVQLVCVGALREKAWRLAADDYRKRLKRYCKLDEREVAPGRPQDPQGRQREEAGRLEKALAPGAVRVALDRRGEAVDSEALAARLERWRVRGQSRVSFMIGGADGLDPTLLEGAAWTWSFSPLTFPHQLFRVMVLEQLYRGFSILEGSPYHH